MKTNQSHPAPAEAPLLRSYMPELDVVRGLAIIFVLFYHGVAPPLNATLSRPARIAYEVSQRGWVGVNLFFVLSGFLITGILLDSRKRNDYFRHFYLRRARRILPALYALLLILVASGYISWRFLVLAALFFANGSSLFGVGLQYPPFWSLAVEEHFYLVWPILVRKFSERTLMAGLASIAIVTPAVRAAGFVLAGRQPDFVGLLTWFNLDGLAAGALLAIWLRQPTFHRLHLKRAAMPMLVAGVCVFLLLPSGRLMNVMFSATACNVASAGLLSSVMLLGTSRWHNLVARPFLMFFGYISYGLYLAHVLAFRIAEILISGVGWVSASPTFLMAQRFFIGSGLAIAVAYLSRRSLEEKFLRSRSVAKHPALSTEPVVVER